MQEMGKKLTSFNRVYSQLTARYDLASGSYCWKLFLSRSKN
ncbi:uncharacterized protein METZ01_LOCUS486530 [marine metagenome]|uniref:Uncharacterized protein n=1 Tax=marine metagenome TaxID=408172 RepID=A0A383CMR0_9ZZZZ